MAKVLIFGTKDFAELAHFYLTEEKVHEVVAFTMDKAYIQEPTFRYLPVVPFEEISTKYPPSDYKLFIPMSYAKMNNLRREKYYQAKEMGYSFVSYISPRATYYNTPVGENCFIFEDNTIQPFTKIGNNVILWSGNHIGHHSTIEDHVFISSHVVISGHCLVGEGSFLGVNSTVSNGVSLGKFNMISSAALVTKNTEDYHVYKAPKSQLAEFRSNEMKGFS